MSGSRKPYCLMPWIHFHINSKGSVNACCVSSIKLGNINNNTVNEIWHDKPITKIREQFLSGKPDKRCGVCINRENGGANSIRQETFDKFPNVNIDSIQSPIYFDIRFSNVCNFRCRTCWHGASSKWFNDAKLLNTNLGEKAIINNINDFNSFINKNSEALKFAKEIYFAGGEPLVTEEHYLLLMFLIDNDITDIKLRYNTNFSVLKFKGYDVLDLWKHFKNVEILASIDESGSLGEYIRKELDWNLFVLNRKKIRGYENIQFKISPTVSVFNISTLPDFYKKCLLLNIIKPNEIYINLLDRPFHYSSKVLSEIKKQEITDKYELFYNWCHLNQIPFETINQFKSCIDFMNSQELHDKFWVKFLEETEKLDKIRNEDFKLI